jgi:hypothetical protein
MVGRLGWVALGATLLFGCAGPLPLKIIDPTESMLVVNMVTSACMPLRGEFTIDGITSVHGLFVKPDCPTPGMTMTNCYRPPEGHPQCPYSCPELTYWQNVNGTTLMHRFRFPVADDGTNSGPMTVVFHLRLWTLYDALITDEDISVEMPVLDAHGKGYFHEGFVQLIRRDQVMAALGELCY